MHVVPIRNKRSSRRTWLQLAFGRIEHGYRACQCGIATEEKKAELLLEQGKKNLLKLYIPLYYFLWKKMQSATPFIGHPFRKICSTPTLNIPVLKKDTR
jgi:hypothetical protein